MASIFDVETKQPIDSSTLMRMGFQYVNYPQPNPKTGKPENNFVWQLSAHVHSSIQKTWVVRYYARGTYYKGQKLRSNRLIYKVFDMDKMNEESQMLRTLKSKCKLPMNRVSKKMSRGGFYTKKYLRNVGKAELDMVVNTVKNM
jgi:hypothetical protein